MRLESFTIHELRDMLDKKDVSSVEVTRAVIDRINATDDKINSFVTTVPEEAIKAAEKADKAIASGDATSLTGIPIAVKDIFCTKGVRSSCGSGLPMIVAWWALATSTAARIAPVPGQRPSGCG